MKKINYLENWDTLNSYVQELTEEELKELLLEEKKGQKRLAFLIRIYGRYNKLRTIRERNELITDKGV